MKNMKFMIIAFFAIVLGVSVTSCNSSEPTESEYPAVVTVESVMGVPTSLTSDFDGLTLIPTNMSALKYANGSEYVKRAWISYRLADGEVITQGKTRYNITITGAQDLVGKKFTVPEELDYSAGAPFVSITDYWGTKDYLTASFITQYNQSTFSLDNFEMYIDTEKTTGDILYVWLHQDKELVNPTLTGSLLYSFKLPTKSEIESLKQEHPNFNLTYQANDSVNVVILAKQSSSVDLESKMFKVRIPN